MTLSTRLIKGNGRRRSTGGSKGRNALGPLYRARLFFDEGFFCLLYAKTAQRLGHSFFSKNRSDMELSLSRKNIKVRK